MKYTSVSFIASMYFIGVFLLSLQLDQPDTIIRSKGTMVVVGGVGCGAGRGMLRKDQVNY